MEHLIATLTRYAKSLTRYTPHIDHRDLVNDTIAKLLESDKEITEGYAITICKNSFRYILARNKTFHKNYKDVRLLLYPEIEEPEAEINLLCKEEHHQLYNWPDAIILDQYKAFKLYKNEYLKEYRKKIKAKQRHAEGIKRYYDNLKINPRKKERENSRIAAG